MDRACLPCVKNASSKVWSVPHKLWYASMRTNPFFFLISHDEAFNIQEIGKLNKFTKLSKDSEKLNDKLIIQHFHYIHIRTLT